MIGDLFLTKLSGIYSIKIELIDAKGMDESFDHFRAKNTEHVFFIST